MLVLENDNEDDDQDFCIDQAVAKKKGLRIASTRAKERDEIEPGTFQQPTSDALLPKSAKKPLPPQF